MNREQMAEVVTNLTRDLIRDGKLIEAGFAIFRHFVIPAIAGPIQVAEMRLAFLAGAQHVYGSIMTALDEGAEPTPADLERMEKIDREIQGIIAELKARNFPTTRGTA